MTKKVDPRDWRPMSDAERKMAVALGRCRFMPATITKRFAADISRNAESPQALITGKQADFLRRSVHTFRRQIPKEIVELAALRPPREEK